MAIFRTAADFDLPNLIRYGSLSGFFEWGSVQVATPTDFVVNHTDDVSRRLTLTGTFTDYVDGYPTTGTIASVSYESTSYETGERSVRFTCEGASIGVAAFTEYALNEDLDSLFHELLSGDDEIIGGSGNNVLQGFAGSDTLRGGAGDDYYYVEDEGDQVVELPDEGRDMVVATASHTLGSNVEDLDLAGGGAIDGIGNELDNVLDGNGAANRLFGGAGNDTLRGGGGHDMLLGGAGRDTASFEFGAAVTVDLSVTVAQNTRYSDMETLHSIENLRGSRYRDTLSGNAFANVIDGGQDADSMNGGAGNDTYIVDNAGDTVVEVLDAGNDTVQASVNYALSAHVERLVLTSGAVEGIGNALANVISGNAEANVLNGRAGADILRGAQGDDTYYVDEAGDKALELANAGIDIVRSTASYTLGLNVEKLVLLGTAAKGSGNGLANEIFGNASANILNGGGGTDTMSGGAGNDTYYVDNAGDRVVESANAGTDVVRSAVSFTLGANLETLVLTVPNYGGGNHAIEGVGNNLANTLYGNRLHNVLDGATGADTMIGGGGHDLYYVDNAGDKVVESSNAGGDGVSSAVDFVLGDNVENLSLRGTAVRGTGNSLANAITGSSGANILAGGSGKDVLDGGAGNDELRGGLSNDYLFGGSGSDVFQFDTALSATLNVDDIRDYSVAADSIGLDRSVFRGIAVDGTLAASAFHTGSAAHDADDRILYDAATGRIYYDADGIGAAGAVHFATVTPGLALTSADFIAYP